MSEIKNILICGLGAIGGYYASVFYNHGYNIKILADKERLERYTKTPRIINGRTYNFDYLLPDDRFDADLIIIATKSNGLASVISNIHNFVGEKTIILSFLNGITSEQKIIEKYGDKVLYSFLLGHTFFRNGNEIIHDGQADINFGSNKDEDERINLLKTLFDKTEIRYKVSDNIIKSQWLKFCFNCCVNQLSAVTRKTFGEIKSSEECLYIIERICDEISKVAKAEGITDTTDFYSSTLKSLDIMLPEGKTSMLQDVESGQKPETDIFGETVCKLGEKHHISTPYNRVLTDILKAI